VNTDERRILDSIYLGIMSTATKEMIDGFPVDFPKWAAKAAEAAAQRLSTKQ
jgi:hypothetical protein